MRPTWWLPHPSLACCSLRSLRCGPPIAPTAPRALKAHTHLPPTPIPAALIHLHWPAGLQSGLERRRPGWRELTRLDRRTAAAVRLGCCCAAANMCSTYIHIIQTLLHREQCLFGCRLARKSAAWQLHLVTHLQKCVICSWQPLAAAAMLLTAFWGYSYTLTHLSDAAQPHTCTHGCCASLL